MERSTTVQDITWFLDLARTNQLELNPTYQRRSVWSTKDQKQFLDTIFKNYPSPSIFIHKNTTDDGQTTYHVVDGKQRLETIIKFSNDEMRTDNQAGDENIKGKKFSELPPNYKHRFWNYKLPVENIDVTDSTDDVFDRLSKISISDVFHRLNGVSKNLNKQELRHAIYRGWFIQEAQEETEQAFWNNIRFMTKSKSKRMLDVQFLSELLMIVIEKKIVGFDQNHINWIYSTYDDLPPSNIQFDEDEYIAEKKRIKEYIGQMLDNYPDITVWTKRQTHLYTLWAFVALYDKMLPKPKKLVSAYNEFMNKVNSLTEQTDPSNLSSHEQHAYMYYVNSRGASADYAPRNERLIALKSGILK